METTEYAVLLNTEYYAGDCQHPQGWSLSVATILDDDRETECIGTLQECREWLDILDGGPTYLSYGQAASSCLIAGVLARDIDYQAWLESNDWDGCPSPDGADLNANAIWVEDMAYDTGGTIPVLDIEDRWVLVDLSLTGEEALKEAN